MERPKKILDNPILGSLVLPTAIILVAALIIFGASKLLFTERSYKDLVYEMRAKTFGNRWVAAFELSKVLASSKIPQAEIPELVEELVEIYKNTQDLRTKDFLVVAIGTLKSESSLFFFNHILNQEKNPGILFHAIVAIGNMPKGISFDFDQVSKFLESKDVVLQQAALLTLASHRKDLPKIEPFLNSSERSLKYSAAIALIHTKSKNVIPLVYEILQLKTGLSSEQIVGLKINAIQEMQKVNWAEFKSELEKISHDQNLVLRAKALDFLKQLNN